MLRTKKRLDQLLLEKELASSLSEAKALIMSGKVIVNDQRVDKASLIFESDVHVRLKQSAQFVSRSGEKLFKLIQSQALETKFNNSTVLDIGSSTGGFTDCSLQLGAQKVFCVDVGTNQLNWKIRQNPKVQVHEQTHIEKFNAPSDIAFNCIVVDISFNSLVRLSEAILRQPTSPPALYILLVKPQFELSSNLVGENGIVDSIENQQLACKNVKDHFDQALQRDGHISPSEVLGRTGNQEYFLVYK